MPPDGGKHPPGGKAFPPLAGPSMPNGNGRYVVIEKCDDDKQNGFNDVSLFLLSKLITNACGETNNFKRMRNGKLLIQTKNDKQAEKLYKLKKMNDWSINVTEHRSLNSSKCVIFSWDLKNEKEEDVLNEIKNQGGINVTRIKKKVNGILENTGALILTFNKTEAPKTVKILNMNMSTRTYYPSPLKCFNCLKFGHTATGCKTEKSCFTCGGKYHGDSCTEEEKCVNCGGNHKSISKECPKLIEENKINKIKIDDGITHFEAKKKFALMSRTYAEVSKTNETNAIHTQKIEEMKKIIDSQAQQINDLTKKIEELLNQEKNQEKRFQQLLTKAKEEAAKRREAENNTIELKNQVQSLKQKINIITDLPKRKHDLTGISPIRKKQMIPVTVATAQQESDNEDLDETNQIEYLDE